MRVVPTRRMRGVMEGIKGCDRYWNEERGDEGVKGCDRYWNEERGDEGVKGCDRYWKEERVDGRYKRM